MLSELLVEMPGMSRFEYKIVPAPDRAGKVARGIKGQDRFAMTLTEAINAYANEGWTFVRTDRLPYTGRTWYWMARTRDRDVMVFQRPADEKKRTPRTPSRIVPDAKAFARDAAEFGEDLKPLDEARRALAP